MRDEEEFKGSPTMCSKILFVTGFHVAAVCLQKERLMLLGY